MRRHRRLPLRNNDTFSQILRRKACVWSHTELSKKHVAELPLSGPPSYTGELRSMDGAPFRLSVRHMHPKGSSHALDRRAGPVGRRLGAAPAGQFGALLPVPGRVCRAGFQQPVYSLCGAAEARVRCGFTGTGLGNRSGEGLEIDNRARTKLKNCNELECHET